MTIDALLKTKGWSGVGNMIGSARPVYSVASQVLKMFSNCPAMPHCVLDCYAYFRTAGRKIWCATVIDVAYRVPSLA
jgi:hypothetical protein